MIGQLSEGLPQLSRGENEGLCHLRKAKKLTEVLDAKDYLVEMGLHSNSARLFLSLLAMNSQILSMLAVQIANHQFRHEG